MTEKFHRIKLDEATEAMSKLTGEHSTSIEDVNSALIELAELLADQDDAIVELAELLEEE